MVYWMEIEMKCSLLTIDFFSMLHSQHYCRIVFVTDISNGHEEKKKKNFVAVSMFLCFTVILQCIILLLNFSAYTTFFILGLLMSMQVPFVGFQPIRTSEHMAAAGTVHWCQ